MNQRVASKAVYPGTFDPITHGHRDIVERAARIFESIVVAVANNPGKQPLFELSERVALAEAALVNIKNVTVKSYRGLTLDLAKQEGASVIVRGIRAVSDFEFEFQLAAMSRHVEPEIETVFLTPAEQYSFLSSTMVRELATYGGDVSDFVCHEVGEALTQHFAHNH